ncbi:terminase small subunit [Tropicimonas sp. TH_r6]|uniref:terminase small subunit n=1 Tax=Tropicimonas sp. TH_r6 TaxID=3082085 RepID=UPI002954E532|nr:terminase small subunit [Tropicimonas sp. TH_r6]MDV7145634.1 terminase small subunit [Tropicimonas sp. TH_r6]
MPLNQRQKAFVNGYLVSGNATKAAVEAGYSAKTARSQGQRLLTNVDISRAIAKRQEKAAEQADITRERALEELAKIGFLDIRKLFSPTGQLVPLHDLEDDPAGAIASVEVVTKTLPTARGEPPEVEYVHRIKLSDKRAALVDIAKMQGWFAEPGNPTDSLSDAFSAIARAICGNAESMPIATQQDCELQR